MWAVAVAGALVLASLGGFAVTLRPDGGSAPVVAAPVATARYAAPTYPPNQPPAPGVAMPVLR